MFYPCSTEPIDSNSLGLSSGSGSGSTEAADPTESELQTNRRYGALLDAVGDCEAMCDASCSWCLTQPVLLDLTV